MLADLNQFYKCQGISAIDFKCPHFEICSQFSTDSFTTAKEAFVSSGYIKHELPRVLFLSLDSGSASNDVKMKTLEAVQMQEEIVQNVFLLPKNKHWYRTHEMAWHLLRNFKKDLKIDEVKKYFAHTNSAKCCMNNPNRGQANAILFNQCKEFIPAEIEILSPDILITQGDYARLSIQDAFSSLDITRIFTNDLKIPEEVKIIEVAKRQVMWIHTFHPRNPHSKMNRDNYPIYEKLSFEFMTKTKVPFDNIQSNKNQEVKKMEQKNISRNPNSMKGDRCIFLDRIPPMVNFGEGTPTRAECQGFEYITINQFCNIAQAHGIGRSKACNAFGGDRGKAKEVISDRMAREVMIGGRKRRFVLVSAVINYFVEQGITNW